MPWTVTQAGIADELTIPRNEISVFLKRTIQKNYIYEKKARVIGDFVPKKVYFLTERGRKTYQSIEEQIRHRKIKIVTGTGVSSQICNGMEIYNILREQHGYSHVNAYIKILESDEINFQIKTEPKKKHNLPETKNFVGRFAELTTIRNIIEKSHGLCIVYGISGIGKTTLISKALENVTSDVFYHELVSYDTDLSLLKSLSTFLRMVGKRKLSNYMNTTETIDMQNIQQILEEDLKGIIIVLDNLHLAENNIKTALALLKSISVKKVTTVIIITQVLPSFYTRKEAFIMETLKEIHLTGLAKNEVLEFFQDSTPENIDKIYHLTEGHPTLLQLIRRNPDTITRDFTMYLINDILLRVSPNGKECLKIISLIDEPLPESLILKLTEETIFYELLSKGLLELHTEKSGYLLLEVLRNFINKHLDEQFKNRTYKKIAHLFFENDDFFKSMVYFHRANDTKKVLKILFDEYPGFLHRGEDYRIIKIINNLEPVNRDIESHAKLAIIKSRILRYQGKTDEACRILNEIKLSQNCKILGEFLYTKGIMVKSANQHDEVPKILNRALKSAKSNPLLKARILRELMTYYGRSGNLKAAQKYFQSAMKLRGINQKEIALLNFQFGVCLLKNNRYVEAQEYFNKAEPHLESPYERVRLLTNLGILYITESRFSDAEQVLSEAITIAHNHGDIRAENYGKTNLGELKLKEHKPEDALKLLNDAKNNFIKINDINMICVALANCIKAYHYLKNHKELKKALLELKDKLPAVKNVYLKNQITTELTELGITLR